MNESIAEVAHPPIVTRDQWLAERIRLLEEEKALTRQYDALNAKRRRLPMVHVDKHYVFNGVDGQRTLLELFGGQVQLIVYHFMFGPDWERGCPGCTSYVNAIADLSLLGERNTSMVLVSRAPFPKLAAYQKEMGWTIPWYSSEHTDFNYDFGVTLDTNHGTMTYNFKPQDPKPEPSEMPGLSVFFRIGDEVYHTYSTYARGGEALTDTYRLLDVTPYGRQEDFEDSPPGWPQRPTYG